MRCDRIVSGHPTRLAVREPIGPGVLSSAEDFHEWWEQRIRASRFEVTPIPFAEMNSWEFDPATGNLGHESGRFFTVEGLQVRVGGAATQAQPIINQPEIGVLGVLVKQFDGVPYCLMQAKMEPGNVNGLQLSPTVQATRSNYTKVHRGKDIRYLEYFTGARRGEVLVDVLQSEQGAWFWRKRNRNIVIQVDRDVPAHQDFRWIPLRLVRQLLRIDNLVNMDARTVLSCMPFPEPGAQSPVAATTFAGALMQSQSAAAPALHSTRALLSWFTEAKTWCDWHVRLVPLAEVPGWSRTGLEITDDQRRDFRIIAIRVAAGNREVARWCQPVLAPRGQGLAVLVVRPINGLLHALVRARPEFGLLDLVEIGPTVQLRPGEGDTAVIDPLLADVVTGRLGHSRFDTVLSEEGGRFYHAQTRYRIVEVGDEFPVEVPPDHCWLTVRQLVRLLQHGH